MGATGDRDCEGKNDCTKDSVITGVSLFSKVHFSYKRLIPLLGNVTRVSTSSQLGPLIALKVTVKNCYKLGFKFNF